MRMKYLILMLFLIVLMAALTGCASRIAQPAPTEVIYQPTRSIATVPVPTKTVSACNNVMGYVEDTTYGDGAVVSPGQRFLKEWEVINYSDCNWDEKYHLYFISGNQMGAPDSIEIPHIPIGSRGKISVELIAPEEPGEYRSEWKLFGADNRFFGESLVVNIIVQ